MNNQLIVEGKFTMKVDCNGGAMAEIYKAIGNAPSINEKSPVVFTIRPLSRKPFLTKYKKTYFNRCYAAEISFSYKMEGSFSKICEDVEKFIEYLTHISHLYAVGSIKIGEKPKINSLVDTLNCKIYDFDF